MFGEAKVLQVLDDEPPDTDEIADDIIDDIVCEDCVPDTDREPIIEEDLGIKPKNKLTTIWATIKVRHENELIILLTQKKCALICACFIHTFSICLC